jgi:uncharacterized protein YaaQ
MILIVSGRQADALLQAFRQDGFQFTIVDSSGGVLNEPTLALFIGLNDSRMAPLLHIVRKYCQPQKEYIPTHLSFQPGSMPVPMIEAQIGGALVYTLDVEQFRQI